MSGLQCLRFSRLLRATQPFTACSFNFSNNKSSNKEIYRQTHQNVTNVSNITRQKCTLCGHSEDSSMCALRKGYLDSLSQVKYRKNCFTANIIYIYCKMRVMYTPKYTFTCHQHITNVAHLASRTYR